MKEIKRANLSKKRGRLPWILLSFGILAFTNLAACSPAWPVFTKRNVQALARDGLLSPRTSNFYDYKRSISTLAKNGMLPTFTVPENSNDEEENAEESDKPNMAALTRLKSYEMKRDTATLARNGVKAGKRFYDAKRNIGSLAKNGYLKADDFRKREPLEDEYYYPFYQNPVPPISELDFPLDYNVINDFEQSLHPDLSTSLPDSNKRTAADLLRQEIYSILKNNPYYPTLSKQNVNDDEFDQVDKRQSFGLPNHGLLRVKNPAGHQKKYILSFPDVSNRSNQENGEMLENYDKKSVDGNSEIHNVYEKRHIGALARLGWLPSFRYSGSRYSRSGRAKYFMPTVFDSYRKYPDDSNSGIGEHLTDAESFSKADTDYADVPPPPVSLDAYSTTGRGGRPVARPYTDDEIRNKIRANVDYQRFVKAIARNRWEPESRPQFYSFRSLKVPKRYQGPISEKRYLLLPAVDNLMLRKTYPNNSLPSRKKNL